MRKFNSFLALMFACFLTSCSSKYYYQVYEVKSENLESQSNMLKFEDENCIVYYNLWDNAGNLSFVLKNKTDNDLVVDLTRSFFIKNGVAYDYYKEQTVTNSQTSALSSTAGLKASYSKVAYEYPTWSPVLVTGQAQVQKGIISALSTSVETKLPSYVIIPAKTSKFLSGFKISDYVYKECGNLNMNYPKMESETIKYTIENSPLSFSNRIAYKFDGKEDLMYIQNDFWVSSLTNYSEKFIIEKVTVDNCDNPKSPIKTVLKTNKKESPDKFYNTYLKLF